MFNKKIKKRGFSIIEVMIAITIFSIGIIGISSMMLQTMQAESLNSGHLKASMLAQEALELVRGLRDENWLFFDPDSVSLIAADIPWDDHFGYTDGTFIIDHVGNFNDTPDIINDPGAMLFVDANGFYQHGPGSPTSFKRLVTVDNSTCVGECWDIAVQVQWNSSGKINNYYAQTTLYNWR